MSFTLYTDGSSTGTSSADSSGHMDCIDLCLVNVLTANCSQLVSSAMCFTDNPVLCNLTRPREVAAYSLLTNNINLNNCNPASTTPTSPPSQDCPTFRSQNMGEMEEAATSPRGMVNPACTDQTSTFTKQLQHCRYVCLWRCCYGCGRSCYNTYSLILFSSYASPVQLACLIPELVLCYYWCWLARAMRLGVSCL